MKSSDRERFMSLLTDVLAFYRRDTSPFALQVWWTACEPFDFEQVAKAMTAHATDPEQGRFPPMPADIVKKLQGTRTDNALQAWGKVLEAMQRVGAYSTVCFDDPAIHAAVEDIGGWVQICRGEMKDLPFLERRFCETYKSYRNRGAFPYPSMLAGAHDRDNSLRGYARAKPVLIGDPEKAGAVLIGGTTGPRTQITAIGQSVTARLTMDEQSA